MNIYLNLNQGWNFISGFTSEIKNTITSYISLKPHTTQVSHNTNTTSTSHIKCEHIPNNDIIASETITNKTQQPIKNYLCEYEMLRPKCNVCKCNINKCESTSRFWYSDNNHVHFDDNLNNIYVCDSVVCNTCQHNICYRCGVKCYFCERYLCPKCISYKYFEIHYSSHTLDNNNNNNNNSNNNNNNMDIHEWQQYIPKRKKKQMDKNKNIFTNYEHINGKSIVMCNVNCPCQPNIE